MGDGDLRAGPNLHHFATTHPLRRHTLAAGIAGTIGFLAGRRTHSMNDYEMIPADEVQQEHDEDGVIDLEGDDAHPLGREVIRLMHETMLAHPDADPATSTRLLGEAVRAHPNGAQLLDYMHQIGEGTTGINKVFISGSSPPRRSSSIPFL